MLVKLLMSLNEKYELKGSTITVGLHEVRATFRFPEHNLPKLREIANDWAERGYINAKHLLMLEKAGMADVARIPPHAGHRPTARLDARRCGGSLRNERTARGPATPTRHSGSMQPSEARRTVETPRLQRDLLPVHALRPNPDDEPTPRRTRTVATMMSRKRRLGDYPQLPWQIRASVFIPRRSCC